MATDKTTMGFSPPDPNRTGLARPSLKHPPHSPDVYDRPALQKQFVSHPDIAVNEHLCQATLAVGNINCSACIGAIERHLQKQPGIVFASINYVTHRAQITWDDTRIPLSAIITAIGDIGYHAFPYVPQKQRQQLHSQYRASLKRLIMAGIFGMQVMMLSMALYLADTSIDIRYALLFRWASALLCTPILLFSAAPFFRAAWRNLKHGKVSMDVSVSLGLAMAYMASLWSNISGTGTIYFDSVAMFVFLLSVARHIELLARLHTNETTARWTQAMPHTATCINEQGEEKRLAAIELKPGDLVRVQPGESIPIDGDVCEGTSCVDESLLSGESLPIRKRRGERVVGGSLNLENRLLIRASASLANSFSSQLIRLMERAQHEKPPAVRLADRIAHYFIVAVIIIAAVVAGFWWSMGAAHWLSTTIAVLIVTCPCALSLATPTAITATSGALARRGVLLARSDAIEALCQVNHWVFDKTGTLSTGKLKIHRIVCFNDNDENTALRIAAAIERESTHPMARAVCEMAPDNGPQATQIQPSTEGGIRATIDQRQWYFGSTDYIAKSIPDISLPSSLSMQVPAACSESLLVCETALVAAFYFIDPPRQEAAGLIANLTQWGKRVSILSGDSHAAVANIATQMGVEQYRYRLTPDEKLRQIQIFKAKGQNIAMVGDGGNDSAAMASAHVSVAMGSGADITQTCADIILAGEQLSALADTMQLAQRTLGIIRQNAGWAIGYNIVALPLAATGYATPWMAAIGMSLSSLVVVINASRLRRMSNQ